MLKQQFSLSRREFDRLRHQHPLYLKAFTRHFGLQSLEQQPLMKRMLVNHFNPVRRLHHEIPIMHLDRILSRHGGACCRLL